MSATETVEPTEQVEQTPAQKEYSRVLACWVASDETEDAVEAVQGMASAAMARAEEAHTEHERMILDLQGTVRDLAEGKLGPVNAALVKELVDVAELTTKRIESAESALYHQSEHIRELQETIEDLIAGSGAALTPVVSTDRTVRVRRNYSPATKDRGWNCEHTLEAVYPLDAIDWEEIARQDKEAHESFEAECARRDRSEGRERRFFS